MARPQHAKTSIDDEWLWVIVGDLPSVYLVTDDAPSPAAALSIYADLMDDWANWVLAGAKEQADAVFPVGAAATPDHAKMLLDRTKYLREEIVPWMEEGDATTHSFGEYVRNVGDVTGDGFPDFADSWSNNSIATKMVTVYSGSNGELIYTLAGPSGAIGSSFGDVLAGAGDIDGDGHEDIGLGVPDESKAYVFSGATGKVMAVTEGQHSMGRSLRGIGDFNGDGRDEWVVGSPGDPQPSGRFEVYGLVGEEIILDFERSGDQVTELPNGAALEDAFGNLIRVSSSGQGQVGPATLDSSLNGPNAGGPDPDLLAGRGNLLILQENAGQSTPGIYDVPDDSRMGGSLFIELLDPMEPLSLVLVDICPGPAKQRARVRLIDSARRSRTFTIPDGFTADGELAPRLGARTLELNTLLDQPGYKATATATEDPGFDPASTMMIMIELSGSGAVDDVRLRRP